MKEFTDNILQTLKNNGFPEKRVSLPTEKMYEAADNRGLSFNKVLEQLNSEHGVAAEVGPDKIIFSNIQEEAPDSLDPQEMIKQAQEMMSQMDPAELQKIQEMFMNMTPEQKEEIMRKGKDLGII